MRPGTYDNASEQRERELLCSQRANEKAKTVAALQREHIRRAEEASRTAKRRSGRTLDKHDSDGREKRRLAVYTGQDGKAGRSQTQ